LLLEYDRFTSIPVPAASAFESSWTKVEVKMEDHVFEYTMDDSKRLEEEINGLVLGEIRPLQSTRPLWRADVLRCLNGPSAIAWIVDHSIGDGIGLLPIGHKFCTFMNGSPYVYNGFSPKRERSVRSSPFTVLKSAISVIKMAITDTLQVLLVPYGPFDSICAISHNATRKNLEYDGKRTIATIPDFDFDDILTIKKAIGENYTVNDILTSCFAGGLRRYLQKMDDPILKTPGNILIRGQAPFGIPRPTIPGKVYCKMSFIVFHFPVGAATVRERLRAVHEEFDVLKNSLQVLLYQWIGMTLMKLGLDSLLIDSSTKLWHRTSFIFSNVPGPRDTVNMFGKKLISVKPYYCNVLHQVIFFSYSGKVSLSMVLDYENIKKPDLIGPCFLEELEAMKRELVK